MVSSSASVGIRACAGRPPPCARPAPCSPLALGAVGDLLHRTEEHHRAVVHRVVEHGAGEHEPSRSVTVTHTGAPTAIARRRGGSPAHASRRGARRRGRGPSGARSAPFGHGGHVATSASSRHRLGGRSVERGRRSRSRAQWDGSVCTRARTARGVVDALTGQRTTPLGFLMNEPRADEGAEHRLDLRPVRPAPRPDRVGHHADAGEQAGGRAAASAERIATAQVPLPAASTQPKGRRSGRGRAVEPVDDREVDARVTDPRASGAAPPPRRTEAAGGQVLQPVARCCTLAIATMTAPPPRRGTSTRAAGCRAPCRWGCGAHRGVGRRQDSAARRRRSRVARAGCGAIGWAHGRFAG